jgi:GH24 family phage-related lysozyme (muramidase)
MKLDLNGVNLLAELEGLELQAYKCSAGVWTIGLGILLRERQQG